MYVLVFRQLSIRSFDTQRSRPPQLSWLVHATLGSVAPKCRLKENVSGLERWRAFVWVLDLDVPMMLAAVLFLVPFGCFVRGC